MTYTVQWMRIIAGVVILISVILLLIIFWGVVITGRDIDEEDLDRVRDRLPIEKRREYP